MVLCFMSGDDDPCSNSFPDWCAFRAAINYSQRICESARAATGDNSCHCPDDDEDNCCTKRTSTGSFIARRLRRSGAAGFKVWLHCITSKKASRTLFRPPALDPIWPFLGLLRSCGGGWDFPAMGRDYYDDGCSIFWHDDPRIDEHVHVQ
jgi:hypothetical protein